MITNSLAKPNTTSLTDAYADVQNIGVNSNAYEDSLLFQVFHNSENIISAGSKSQNQQKLYNHNGVGDYSTNACTYVTKFDSGVHLHEGGCIW